MANSEQATETKSVASQLLGEWTVALYFSAASPPSSTTMVITNVSEDGTLVGTFYQTPFETARYTVRDDIVAFVLITSDNSGLYSSSGRVTAEGQIDGQTLSTGRNFLMTWTATKR